LCGVVQHGFAEAVKRVILRRMLLVGLTAAALVGGTGCISRGPSSIAQQRGSYTDVLSHTDKEELLTNIVRLAYSDPPVFLQVSSVTASPSLEYGTESEFRLGDGSSPNPLVLAKPRVIAKDSPTIVYKPLLGREFASELLLPFDIRPVFMMIDNGFDFSVVAQLTFKSLNGISNSRGASNEERRRFREVTDAIARLLKQDAIRIGTPPEGLNAANAVVVVHVRPAARDLPDVQVVAAALGLDPTRTEIPLRVGLQASDGSLAVSPRSLLALLSYLSNYVQPPPEHAALVWPTEARQETDPLLRVLSSRTRPDNADPAIFYKGYWFYVRADDLRSRNTLFLLRLLFNLQAQSAAGDGVQLTLPVR